MVFSKLIKFSETGFGNFSRFEEASLFFIFRKRNTTNTGRRVPMKIRIRDNSIRLRLTQNEVLQAKEQGLVEAYTQFAEGLSWKYRLVTFTEEKPKAALTPEGITVYLPKSEVTVWADTAQVGIRGEQDNGSEKTLKILVEKDFKCLKPRNPEEDADTFPHPAEGSKC